MNCTVFGKQAENFEKYISKGALIGVEGSIRV
ncbi:single-stranded DNA-binding protein [Candidatus Phytoplasma asteris]